MFQVHSTATGVTIDTTSREMLRMDRLDADVAVGDSQHEVQVSWVDLRDAFRQVAQAHDTVQLAKAS